MKSKDEMKMYLALIVGVSTVVSCTVSIVLLLVFWLGSVFTNG